MLNLGADIMIWAKEETLSREEIEAIQLEKLKKVVSTVYEKVAPYRAKWTKQASSLRTLKASMT